MARCSAVQSEVLLGPVLSLCLAPSRLAPFPLFLSFLATAGDGRTDGRDAALCVARPSVACASPLSVVAFAFAFAFAVAVAPEPE